MSYSPNTIQTSTPTGATYAWVLTAGNDLNLILTSSTGDVTVTTSVPTIGGNSNLTITGHGSLSYNVILSQSGVTWVINGDTYATTAVIEFVAPQTVVNYVLLWQTATRCIITKMGTTDGIFQLGRYFNVDPYSTVSQKALRCPSINVNPSITNVTVSGSPSFSPVAGGMYMINGSNRTYSINTALLGAGDMFYLMIANGCPSNVVNYNDAFGASVPMSFALNTKYYYTCHYPAAAGLVMYGGSV